MKARATERILRERFGAAIQRADVPAANRLYLYADRRALRDLSRFVFRDLGARYVVSVGFDDRPYSGHFLVSHQFALDREGILMAVLSELPPERPEVPSIAVEVPAAGWAERELRDLVGIEPVGHPYPKRLVLPDGWPEGVYPLRKEVPHDHVPAGWDPEGQYPFDPAPEGCTVVPLGPFHPTLDEPAHFRLYVEGETVRGCEYRGFMVHRGVEKLAESVLGYNDIPMLAERICGICGCVHNVAYAQAVESVAGIQPPPRAEYIRTIMLEIERLHSHLLWVGLACHLVGFDTLFMQAFRIREPVMWIAEKISGNRKTYALCLVGGVRWEITPALADELRAVLDRLEREWRLVARAVEGDRNLQRRTRGVGGRMRVWSRSTACWGRWHARPGWTSMRAGTTHTRPMIGWLSTSWWRRAVMCGRVCWCARRRCSSRSVSSGNAWPRWNQDRSRRRSRRSFGRVESVSARWRLHGAKAITWWSPASRTARDVGGCAPRHTRTSRAFRR